MLKTVSSMGGGGASSNVFATDITVNGLTVGRGDGNVTTNTTFGDDALGSPYITSSNTNNVGIGYNALNIIGAGVATFTNLVGGSGYVDGDGLSTFTQTLFLTYVSGTPLISGGVFPYVTIQVTSGAVTAITFFDTANRGYGFTDITTVMTAAIGDAGSGFSVKVGTLFPAANNVAVGYNAGNTNKTGANSVYLGSGATGTGSNQIAIGANATIPGNSNNYTLIGNANTVTTELKGTLYHQNAVTFTGGGNIQIGSLQGFETITIGASQSSGTITIGKSTTTQTIDISTGAVINGDFKYINIGTGSLAGSGTEIQIGATLGESNTKVNGLLNQQTYTVVNLPSFAVIGSRSFVTNASSPVFGSNVVGGGSVNVPVYYDGTNWKVG